jgi:hypothetical protein
MPPEKTWPPGKPVRGRRDFPPVPEVRPSRKRRSLPHQPFLRGRCRTYAARNNTATRGQPQHLRGRGRAVLAVRIRSPCWESPAIAGPEKIGLRSAASDREIGGLAKHGEIGGGHRGSITTSAGREYYYLCREGRDLHPEAARSRVSDERGPTRALHEVRGQEARFPASGRI